MAQVFGRRDQLGLRKAKKGSTKKGSGKGKKGMKRQKSFRDRSGLRKLRRNKRSASSLMSETPEPNQEEQDESMEDTRTKPSKKNAKGKAAAKRAAAAKPKAKAKAKSKAKAAAPATGKSKGATGAKKGAKKSSPSKAEGKANKAKGKRAADPTPEPPKKSGKRKAAQEQSFAGAAEDLDYIVYFANTFNFEAVEDMKEEVKEWLPNYESCGFDVFYTQKRYGCGVYLRATALESLETSKKTSLCYFSFGQTDQGFAVAVGAAICLEARSD